jgi:methyl-accepting chemotaxis protein
MAPTAFGKSRRSLWNVFVIEEGFKQRQIMRLLGLSFLNVVVSTAAFVAFQNYEMGLRMDAGLSFVDLTAPSLLRIAIVWACLMSATGGLFALLTGLLMTHRMGGPIYKFKHELRRIESGHPPQRISLRKGDEFHDVAEALNGALEVLWSRTGGDAGESGALALDLENVRQAHAEILAGLAHLDLAGLPEASRARIEALVARVESLGEKLEA